MPSTFPSKARHFGNSASSRRLPFPAPIPPEKHLAPTLTDGTGDAAAGVGTLPCARTRGPLPLSAPSNHPFLFRPSCIAEMLQPSPPAFDLPSLCIAEMPRLVNTPHPCSAIPGLASRWRSSGSAVALPRRPLPFAALHPCNTDYLITTLGQGRECELAGGMMAGGDDRTAGGSPACSVRCMRRNSLGSSPRGPLTALHTLPLRPSPIPKRAPPR